MPGSRDMASDQYMLASPIKVNSTLQPSAAKAFASMSETFSVDIVSEAFAGQLPLARHRAIYAALGTMMTEDIHALSIRAETGAERTARDAG